MPGPADTLDVVRGMLVDVIGPEYLIGLDIELETAFDADLELESLEFVAMAERLLQHYGEQVDFVAWLATMELDDIIGLTVGRLVSFINTSVGSEPVAVTATVNDAATDGPGAQVAESEAEIDAQTETVGTTEVDEFEIDIDFPEFPGRTSTWAVR